MNERIIREATRAAKKSSYRFRVGAVLYAGSRIISSGYNKPNKTHPKSNTKYQRIHAELDAIIKSGYYNSPEVLHNASIYVHRLWRTNEDGLAKPCSSCETMLRKVGIKRIYYSG